MHRFLLVALVAILFANIASADAVPVTLARGGQPQVKLVVAENASARVKQAAADLAEMLGKITGGKFESVVGDGSTGIALGLPGDFPGLPYKEKWAKPTIVEREDYLLRTHANGAHLIGATEQAVEHAVWDFLHRIGYRQFFPGEHWEVIPKLPDASVAVDVQESPSYRVRRIWYGFGPWDYATEPYKTWCIRNRATGGMDLHSGHSYGGIISALKKEFDSHPEYYAQLNGERRPNPQSKMCLSNEELRKKIVAHEIDQFRKKPEMDSVSLDPSDGGGWCECEKCAKLGSISDRALTLANEVAAGVNAQIPGKYVGMYAYAYHSPPPTIRVHPNVIISVATSFIKGGLTFNELVDGWASHGATIGIREYYGVNTWDRDLPGHARGGNLAYLTRTIPDFHARGGRFMSAESSDNWGPNGLGYYVASRLLWNVKDADKVNELVEDFLTKAFGPAKEPMREFYKQIDGSTPHPVADDQLGRMFRALEEARKLTAGDAAVNARLNALTLYAHYTSLYHTYADAKGKPLDHQKAFETLIRHAYRMRTTMLVHTKALYRDLAGRDKSVTIPTEAKWSVPEGKNPWKSSAAFTDAEIAGFIAEGVKNHQPVMLTFEPKTFGDTLLPAEALKLPAGTTGEFGGGRGAQTFLTHISKVPFELELKITGGLIAHYRDRGNVKVTLVKLGGASQTGELETLIAEDRSVPPDGKERTVKLTIKEAGQFKLTVSDGGDKTHVTLPDGVPFVVPSSEATPMSRFYSRWNMVFYVPKGTKVVGLFGGEYGEVLDANGKSIFTFLGKKPGYYGIDVPEGQDGKVWRIKSAVGVVKLLTVPPYFATSAKQLLVPAEVIEADAKR